MAFKQQDGKCHVENLIAQKKSKKTLSNLLKK